MSRSLCPRVWEAEAIEDGRVTGPERLAFERHVSTCRVCMNEISGLAKLKESMRQAPALQSSPLERLRARGLLLRRANEYVLGPARGRRIQYAVASLSIAVLTVCGLLFWKPSFRSVFAGTGPAVAIATTSPRYEIAATEGTQWSDKTQGGLARIVLEQGTTTVHVNHLKVGQRFLLAMPDGEVEVHGTRFVVEVRNKTTQRVTVTEGIVTLRLWGRQDQLLRAGSHWAASAPANDNLETNLAKQSAPSETESTDVELTPAKVADSAPAKPESNANTTRQGNSRLSTAASAPSDRAHDEIVEPRASGTKQDSEGAQNAPSKSFAEAVATFSAGNYSNADRLLRQFLRDFSKDPRAEDAAFLLAVAKSRSGDKVGAAALAKEYLRKYPGGLRRSEAERMVAGVEANGE